MGLNRQGCELVLGLLEGTVTCGPLPFSAHPQQLVEWVEQEGEVGNKLFIVVQET